ncbi:MAG: bifunctional folylpolyglutamate synthase/dihydrofolate synthase, partial [Acidobacteriota bacterium]
MALPPETAALLDRLARFGTRLGLERIRALLAGLGDPQDGVPTVLVAGTNGKGTVAALLASFGVAGRYRTGLYTSPHLETPEERLRLDGAAIDPERLGELLERVLAAAGRLDEPPTYFEAITAAAVLWFAEEKVELAILEVGLGGRFDATNAVEPSLGVITAVGLDHREHLGDTLEEVAREKAGILRTGVPVVTAGGAPEVVRALEAEASRVGAERIAADARLRVEAVQRFRPFSGEPLRQRIWLRRPGPEEAEAAGEADGPPDAAT